MRFTIILALGLFSAPAFAEEAEEFALQLRTLDDADIQPDRALCAAQSFPVNLILGATVWSTRTDKHTGEVYDDTRRQVGTGTACFQLTDFTFPVGNVFPVTARFKLANGTYTGTGTCTVTSNDQPVKGLILAACSARVNEGPKGFKGGVATTTTVINVFHLPGFTTGSYLTIRGYREPTRPWWWHFWRRLGSHDHDDDED